MESANWTDLDRRAVDTARVLAADAVEKVGNGHPGTAISLAPVAYLLFQNVMRHDPTKPDWIGRDRFVLSAGHSCLTLYNQLFLSGYGLELEDIEALRTWGSLTPGHPEYRHTAGVEMTTGPLGQGLASSVGMAMGARRVRGLLDPEAAPGTSPFDSFVYVIAGDGCLEEGVTSEASSLAGTLNLGNLIVIWDDNRITIEGNTSIAFSENVMARYEAYGWHTQHVDWTAGGEYLEDVDGLLTAIKAAQAVTDKPSFIRLSTIIGWPLPHKAGSHDVHGAKLGSVEIAALKERIGFDPQRNFQVDAEVLAHARAVITRGQQAKAQWDEELADWAGANPQAEALYERLAQRELPMGWKAALPTFAAGTKVATRAASGDILTALADVLPELWGGSADLAGSNNTTMKGQPSFIPAHRSSNEFQGNQFGRTLHFGVREHGMGAILSGISLYGFTRPYGGTFFSFADYMRGAVRLAALMGTPTTYVWTHDSIGLGEDGPTHQPVEHLAAYRAIPGLDIVRPMDANETVAAWAAILERDNHPTGLILSRQALPVVPRGTAGYASASNAARGGYVLVDSPTGKVDVILMATGSEVQYAIAARDILAKDDIGARVVSMPCLEWFAEQDDAYREEVLPSAVCARVSVEAGLALSWYPYLGAAGRAISLEHFGASAAAERLFEEFGFTADNVATAARQSLAAAASCK